MIRNLIRGPALQMLAKEDILATTLGESTVKAIVRGSYSNGPFDSFIMSFQGYHLNDPNRDWYRDKHPKTGEPWQPWDVLYHGPGNKNGFEKEYELEDETYDLRPQLYKDLGLYPMGGMPWERSIYMYQFEWN